MTTDILAPLPVTLTEVADNPAVHAILASLPKYFRPVRPGAGLSTRASDGLSAGASDGLSGGASGGPGAGAVVAVTTLAALRAALHDRPSGILLTGTMATDASDAADTARATDATDAAQTARATDAADTGRAADAAHAADVAGVRELAERVRELAEHAHAIGVPVVVAGPWALDPGVTAVAGALNTEGASLIEVTATVPAGRSPADVLLDQLALLRTALAPARAVEVIQADAHGHLARAQVGEVPVHLAATVSGLGTRRARLDVLGPSVQWRLSFADPATAGPATVVRTDADGEHLFPTVYESAYRAAWRHLHAAVTHGAVPPYSLRDLADDLALLAA
ncbi:hypothetical protein ACQP2T_29160 [Nonomuraea sp. CA-143628]|uniref:hypothetical protein n=1 Tax=Nonomuraea sp. CA-143628 TaxID=3239997 RepID=UPI003D91629F